MKKFSNITGEKISEQKPIEVNLTELDLMKAKISNLMENYLRVQVYGPVDRYQRAGSIKVAGKELFLEALISLLDELTNKKTIKILEKMKSETGDWKALDSKIDYLNFCLENDKDGKMITHKEKIRSIISKTSDRKKIIEQIDFSVSKISNPKTALLRSLAAKSMMEDGNYDNEVLSLISEKYLLKYKELK
jgi:hypothetical protein